MTDPLALVYLLPRSTLNHHPPGPLLQLFHLAEMGYQQQLWIILYLFLVKRNSPFNSDVSSQSTATLFIIVHLGGWGNSYSSEILSYESTSDSWNVAGKLTKPRMLHGVSLLIDVSEVCP